MSVKAWLAGAEYPTEPVTSLHRGDLIAFCAQRNANGSCSQHFDKRVIAVGGDYVEITADGGVPKLFLVRTQGTCCP